MKLKKILCLALALIGKISAMEKPQESPFVALPNEIKMNIVLNLVDQTSFEQTLRNITNAARINKDFYALVNDTVIMKKLVEKIDYTFFDMGHWIENYDRITLNNYISKQLNNPENIGIADIRFISTLANMPAINNPEFALWMESRIKQKPIEECLRQAAAMGNKKAVEEYVLQCKKEKCNINARDIDGKTALHRAVNASQYEIAQKLLDAGADINVPDKWKIIPFHAVIDNYEGLRLEKFLDAFFKYNPDFTITDNFGRTPLQTALHEWSPQELKQKVIAYIKDNNIGLSDELKELFDKANKENV